jgi:4-carboxymuconolactone decarboxylase
VKTEGVDMSSYDDGLAMRRKVLGDDYVDKALAAVTDLDEAFQDWITSSVWGGVWARDSMDLRTRSLITIAILAAMNQEELGLHLRAARNTGVSQEDLTDVLLHVAVYAGVPAANRAFKMAKTAYAEADT